jgi:hypothetical protein
MLRSPVVRLRRTARDAARSTPSGRCWACDELPDPPASLDGRLIRSGSHMAPVLHPQLVAELSGLVRHRTTEGPRRGTCRAVGRATRRTRGCPGKRLNGATSPAFDDFVRLPCLARFSRPTFLARRGEGRTRPGPSPLLEVVTGASWARPQRSDGVVEQDSRKSSLRPAADHGWARVPIPPAPSTRTISQSRPSPSSEADLSADLARISETPPAGRLVARRAA